MSKRDKIIKIQTQVCWILDKYKLKGAKGQSCKLKGAKVQTYGRCKSSKLQTQGCKTCR